MDKAVSHLKNPGQNKDKQENHHGVNEDIKRIGSIKGMSPKRAMGDGQNIALATNAAIAVNGNDEGKKLLDGPAMNALEMIAASRANMIFKPVYEQNFKP